MIILQSMGLLTGMMIVQGLLRQGAQDARLGGMVNRGYQGSASFRFSD